MTKLKGRTDFLKIQKYYHNNFLEMSEERKLAAIMFTDIVGYSRLMAEDEENAYQLLKTNRQIQKLLIEKHSGKWLKEIGDGILASFLTASAAVYCAKEIQESIKEEPDLKLRIGISLGDVIFEDEDVFGDGVNIASRLESIAQVGEIYISESVFWNIQNKKGLKADFIKETKLKNVKNPVKIYSVRIDRAGESIISQKGNRIRRKLLLILTGILILVISTLLIWKYLPEKQIEGLEKSIAVRPFWNESADQENEYFVNGFTEEIRNNLAKISGLQVRSRGSMEKYRNSELSTKKIAKELEVIYILEGTVQRLGDQIKIHAQLILAKDDNHIWENSYERDMSDAKEVYNIQSQIAHSVAEELKVIITPNEKNIIETVHTKKFDAYDYYLRGEDYRLRSYEEYDYKYAIQMYEKAIEIDSNFALAWVGLAAASRSIYWFYYDRSDEILLNTKRYLDKALSLSPHSKEVLLEEGNYYYMCELDYPKAIQLFEKLKVNNPNDDDLYFWIAMVYRRMGEFKKSFEYNKHAITLNPSNWLHWLNAGLTLQTLGEYSEAEKYQKKVIELNPSVDDTFWYLIVLYSLKGEITKAKEFSKTRHEFIDRPYAKLILSNIEILDENYEEAIKIIESISDEIINDQGYYGSKHLQLGLIYYLMSNEEMSTRHFEAERIFLEEKIEAMKYDPRLYRSLGIVYAGLGNKINAINAGRKAIEILSFKKDAIGGFYTEMDMAKILLMVGEYDEAISKLEFLLQKTGYISVQLLQIDPFWNPIKNTDEFNKIISNPQASIRN